LQSPSPDILSNIYSAAIAPEDWQTALDCCVEHVGARSAAVMSADALTPEQYTLSAMSTRLVAGISGGILERWINELAPLEAEGHIDMQRQPARQLWFDNEFWPDDVALKQRADYQFLREHAGIHRKIGIRLNDNPRWYETIAFHFPAELDKAPASSLEPIRQLIPHVAKAVELTSFFVELQRRHSAVLAALDHVAVGMVVLDKKGYVVLANLEALRILEEGHGIQQTANSTLACTEPAMDAQLRSAVSSVSLGLDQNRTNSESLLVLRRDATSEPLIVEFSPLQDGRRELDAFNSGVLVQLIDVGSHPGCDIKRFALAWSLTDAEADVAQFVVAGMTNNEIADHRGVKPNTVKSQVSRLMNRCRTESRVELVRAILKTVPPVS